MSRYLIIESRDPFDSNDVSDMYDIAGGLTDRDDVTVFLVQNGVLAGRRASTAGAQVAELARRTTVLADDFSLRERGIEEGELADGVTTASMDQLVDLLVEDDVKALWH